MNRDKFIIARIVSARAFQLAVGADPLVRSKGDERFEDVARKEYEKGVVPLKPVKRKK